MTQSKNSKDQHIKKGKNHSASIKKQGLKVDKNKINGLKESQLLEEVKESLDSLMKILNKTSYLLPSMVTIKETNNEFSNGILHDKFNTDYEMISMLEEFFVKLVLLLKYRSSYDEKLSQIFRQIVKLKNINSFGEFQGNLQLLGIMFNETEQIIKNYEDMYKDLFTEQALLQFQLMEQLSMFKERNVPVFTEIFDTGIKTFLKLNEKISKFKE